MVYARLARRLRSLGIVSFDDYMRFLELEPAEWEHCTNALTTNVTSFYREEHHFAILAEHARATAVAGEPFRVWSAGCSTGEEPYTIAMCLAEALPGQRLQRARERPRHAGARHRRARRSIRCSSVQKLDAPSARSASSCAAPAASRAARACAARSPRTWSSLRVNLMDARVARRGRARRDLLPQRDDLFRQAHAAAPGRALRRAAAPERALLRGPRGEPPRPGRRLWHVGLMKTAAPVTIEFKNPGRT